MKYLGIDFGLKKIGISISDIDGKIAFPKDILFYNSGDLKHIDIIHSLCDTEFIENIVIGQSKDLDGKDNNIENKIIDFINILNKDNKYIIHRIDERFTTSLIASENRFNFQKKQNNKNFSRNAKSVRDNSKDDDARVAAVILQNFLDSKAKI